MQITVSQVWQGVRFSPAQVKFLESCISGMNDVDEVSGSVWECQPSERATTTALAGKGVLEVSGARGDDGHFEVRLQAPAKLDRRSNDDVRAEVIKWRDMGGQEMRLRCGEMTSQEICTVRAVLRQICPE